MLDMSDAFDDDTMHAATVTRPKAGQPKWIEGYAMKAKPDVFQITASVQPMGEGVRQQEYQRLPEGIRNEAECLVYTTFRLQSGDLLDCPVGKFKVLSLDDFQPLGGYTKAILGGMKATPA